MADPFRPLPVGASVTQFSRTAYNELLKMLKEWRAEGPGSPNRSTRSVAEVLVKNASAVTMPAFSIMGIDAPIVSPATNQFACQQRPAFSCVEATQADHAQRWVALEEPIAAGKIGKGVAMGFAVVRLYVTAAGDKFCDAIDQKTVSSEDCWLGSGASGTPILWRENAGSGAGTIVWAIVRVGTFGRIAQTIRGTLGGALTTTTASQTISSPVSMDGGVLPSGTITGYNVYTTKGFAGPSGGTCVAMWDHSEQRYQFIDVECP